MSETTTKNAQPVFYTPNREEYQGTKVALWAGKAGTGDKRPAQFTGKIGTIDAQLWEGNGSRGVFYNVKTADEKGELTQIGNANAYITPRGFNSLSISLKFATEAEAQAAKEKLGLKEAIKPFTKDGVSTFYINIYADVSPNAVKGNPDEFKRLGFKTEFEPRATA